MGCVNLECVPAMHMMEFIVRELYWTLCCEKPFLTEIWVCPNITEKIFSVSYRHIGSLLEHREKNINLTPFFSTWNYELGCVLLKFICWSPNPPCDWFGDHAYIELKNVKSWGRGPNPIRLVSYRKRMRHQRFLSLWFLTEEFW